MNHQRGCLYSHKKLVDNVAQVQFLHAIIHSLKIAAQCRHGLAIYSIHAAQTSLKPWQHCENISSHKLNVLDRDPKAEVAIQLAATLYVHGYKLEWLFKQNTCK